MKQKLKVLLLLLLISAGAYAQTNYDVITVDNGLECTMRGNGRDGSAKAISNAKKNRWNIPAEADFDRSITIDDFIGAKKNDSKFDEKRAVSIEGYVVKAFASGLYHGESCNCGAKEP